MLKNSLFLVRSVEARRAEVGVRDPPAGLSSGVLLEVVSAVPDFGDGVGGAVPAEEGDGPSSNGVGCGEEEARGAKQRVRLERQVVRGARMNHLHRFRGFASCWASSLTHLLRGLRWWRFRKWLSTCCCRGWRSRCRHRKSGCRKRPVRGCWACKQM